MIERVVVPFDFTAESARALAVAGVLAGWAGVSVELVSVVEPSGRAAVESKLAKAAGGVGRVAGGATWRVVESGGPVEAALLTELHRSEKELWCVGSHARGALGMTLRLFQVGEPDVQVPPDAMDTAYLRHAAGKVPSIDRDAVDYDILHGEHPADDLASYVAGHPDVGTVALATRGLSGVDRLLHGSTAFDLAHRGPVPVLILHHV